MASLAALPGNWIAWLSDDTTNARDRLIGDRVWQLVDGTVIADSRSDLLDSNLDNPINLSEFGVARNTFAWTGTTTFGQGASDNCGNWSGGSGVYGICGRTLADNAEWTDYLRDSECNSIALSLYCFETE